LVPASSILLDHELELEDPRGLPGGLLMRMHEWRCNQVDLLPWQLELLAERWGRGQREHHCGGASQCGSSGHHRLFLSGPDPS